MYCKSEVVGVDGNLFNRLKHQVNKENISVASYSVKLKSFDELNKEFNRVYIINEDATDIDLTPLERNNEYKLIYNKIQNGTNTINLLNKALLCSGIMPSIFKLLPKSAPINI